MTDYEKGSPAWDIGHILTVHEAGLAGRPLCARVAELRRTAFMRIESGLRLRQALDVACTCGNGDSPGERTSLRVRT